MKSYYTFTAVYDTNATNIRLRLRHVLPVQIKCTNMKIKKKKKT